MVKKDRLHFATSVALYCSLIVNLLLLWKLHAVQPIDINSMSQCGQCNKAEVRCNDFAIVDKVVSEGYSEMEQSQRSIQAFNTASRYTGALGHGQLGWLWLLASVDLDRRNIDAIYNLVNNYEELYSGYSSLAYSELTSAINALSIEEITSIMSPSKMLIIGNRLKSISNDIIDSKEADFPKPCTTYAFTTSFVTYDFRSIVQRSLNDDLYTASIAAYLKLKEENPQLSSTDLNHEFFRYQMKHLDKNSNSFWNAFEGIGEFGKLVSNMRFSAFKYLLQHGLDRDSALRKASHPLIIWVSVHDENSVHQPHVTSDALVGGVYYIRTPSFAGRLQIYDPRGKGPIGDGLKVPTSPPSPPFHREMSVKPVESKLVLFPGWLVHSVMGGQMIPNRTSPDHATKDGSLTYRVSLSLNLKGEWQDTSSLHVQGHSCVP